MIELKAYEGLIRNHVQLAQELNLEVEGMPRRQREEALMVAAYKAWGTHMGSHLNGQFAVALWDTEKNQLFCTRDILGAELLFYYETPEGTLLYATQIKDLLEQPGFSLQLNEAMMQFYLALNYVPGEDTLFAGVHKLEPGGYLIFNGAGLQLGRYWELAFDPDESKTLEDWAEALDHAMDESMRDILDAGEQPDSFLSGGVDSSYLLAKGPTRRGYCVSYANQEVSEEEQARATAEYLGKGFEGIEVTPQDFFATVDEFLLAYEQPSADPAGLALYCAAKKLVDSQTASLCFSGEGADEFFAGYNVYRNASKYEKGNATYYGSTWAMRTLDIKHYLKRFHKENSLEAFMQKHGAGGKKYDTVSWMLYTDIRTYFEASILFNSTKICRGTGLDVRMPYCDLRIFDIACHMPSRYKVSAEGNKLALRKAALKVLPEEVAYRKKLGFPVPVQDWLADSAYNGDIRRAFESETAAKFFKQKEIQALLDEFLMGKSNLWHKARYHNRRAALWRRVWSIYLLIRWYELFFIEQ